jgi:hypothetical protein
MIIQNMALLRLFYTQINMNTTRNGRFPSLEEAVA